MLKCKYCSSIKTSLITIVITAQFLLSTPITTHAKNRKNGLILKSFHQVYFWIDGIMDGIQSGFAEENLVVEFCVEDMGTKEFIHDLSENIKLLMKTKPVCQKTL